MDSLSDVPSVRRMDGGGLCKRWRWVAERELWHLERILRKRSTWFHDSRSSPQCVLHLESSWTIRRESALRFEYVPLPRVGQDDLLLTNYEWAGVFLDQQRRIWP